MQTSLKYPSLSRARHKATQRSVRLAQIVVVALHVLHHCGTAILVRSSAHRGFALPLQPRHLGKQMDFEPAPLECESLAPIVERPSRLLIARLGRGNRARTAPAQRARLTRTLARCRPAASLEVFTRFWTCCECFVAFWWVFGDVQVFFGDD